MKRIYCLFALLFLAACAHLGAPREGGPTDLWQQAHDALGAADFARATSLFARLAREYPDESEGRESLFYLGSIRLDPRNPEWDPKPAEETLQRYLAADSARPGSIHRRPEAQTFLQLAMQLNMPAEERVPGLQPETRVVTREVPVARRVVVPARESRALAAEVARLKQQVAERDEQIRQQREELERIRRTLTRPK